MGTSFAFAKRVADRLIERKRAPGLPCRHEGSLAELSAEPVANTPAQFAAFQQQEYARWKQVIETRKITAD